jgi:hypothetical protein
MFPSQICDCDSAKVRHLITRLSKHVWIVFDYGVPNDNHQPQVAAFGVKLVGDVLSVSEFQFPKAYVNAIVQASKVQNATHNQQFPCRTDIRTERDALGAPVYMPPAEEEEHEKELTEDAVPVAAPARDYHDQEGAPKSFPAFPTSGGPHSAAQTATDPHTDAGKPKAQIDSESCTALKKDSTLRCLYKARFTLDSSLSEPVTTWAGSLVEMFCRALLQSIGREAAIIDKRILMLQVLRRHIFICFDLFLEECDAQLRKEVEQSNKRPIYAISQKANVYRVRRWKVADEPVAAEFTSMQGLDKGERSHFSDAMYPPVYGDGVLLDGFLRGDCEAEDSEEHNEADSVDEHE